MSARFGDNVTRRSDQMGWYAGPTLLEHLETIVVDTLPAERAVPLPGAVCEPPQPRLPRLCRHDRLRLDRAGRRGRGRQVRQGVAGQAHRHAWRRSRPRGRGAGGHAGAGGRGRGVARQHAGVAGCPAERRRPVRGQHRLVRRERADPRPLLHRPHRDRPGQRHRQRSQIPHRRQQLRA